MAHSITVRLNKPAREFQAGENIGFNIRAGVQYYDRQTKRKNGQTTAPLYFPSRERKRITTVVFLLKVALWKLPEKTSGLMFTRGKMVNQSLLNY